MNNRLPAVQVCLWGRVKQRMDVESVTSW
jgi:hypothetical protein